jgi:hypothetical protein
MLWLVSRGIHRSSSARRRGEREGGLKSKRAITGEVMALLRRTRLLVGSGYITPLSSAG